MLLSELYRVLVAHDYCYLYESPSSTTPLWKGDVSDIPLKYMDCHVNTVRADVCYLEIILAG